MDLCIVEPIDAVEVLVKSKIIVQRVKSFPSCNQILTSDTENRRRTGVSASRKRETHWSWGSDFNLIWAWQGFQIVSPI